LEFKLISIHSRIDVYEAVVMSASIGSAYFFKWWRISAIRSIATVFNRNRWQL